MSVTIDRRDGAIRTRNRPGVPSQPFQPTDQKDQPGGYASLDGSSGLVPATELGTGTPDATTALFGDGTFKATATTAALTAETNARTSADNTLTTNLNAEITNRTNADSTHAALTTTAHGGIVASTDPRLSDARTPTAHASSHEDGGLDAIETSGTWAPSVGGSATYTTQTGKYRKIGKKVYVYFDLHINAIGTGSASLVSGLPFTTAAGTPQSGVIAYFTGLAVNVIALSCYTNANATTFQFTSMAAAGPSVTNAPSILTSGTEIIGSIEYETA